MSPSREGINQKRRLSQYAVFISLVLFGSKLWAWIASGSLAVLSDALNSALDVFSYAVLAICINIQDKAPDANHPYGHRRAEPLASMLIALIAALLGFTLLKDGMLGLFDPVTAESTPVGYWVLGFSIVAKLGLVAAYRVSWAKSQSVAIKASLVDSRNDILASLVALLGFSVGGLWDTLAAMLIGMWIIWSGVRVGLENLGYVMGHSPPPDVLSQLRDVALSVSGVHDTNDLLAHYVGDHLHVELHAEVDSHLSLKDGHRIETEIRERLEDIPGVGRAFVHLDLHDEAPSN
ncbi:MAG: cation diffusion facilitator family transporter [Limnochordia bacterium]